jgi:hypothetical protein
MIFFFVAALAWACTDDEAVGGVDPELQLYFDRFEEEGRMRGMKVNFDSIGISADLTIISNIQVAGTCRRHSESANDIDISGTFWNRSDEWEREFVVFHELGHCYLNREHLETTNSDGTCESIMASGTGSCVNNYNESSRSIYLDELFER